MQFKVPFLFENPLVSEVWALPALRSLSSQPGARIVLADQCRFGAPWRRRTRFLAYGVADEDLHRLHHLCQASTGLCVRTHRRHTRLCGHRHGLPLTLQAERLPPQTCTSVAYALTAPWHTSSAPSLPPLL